VQEPSADGEADEDPLGDLAQGTIASLDGLDEAFSEI